MILGMVESGKISAEEAERLLSSMVTRAVQACTRPPTVTYEVVDGDPSVVLVDAAHRAELPAVYNRYQRTDAEAG